MTTTSSQAPAKVAASPTDGGNSLARLNVLAEAIEEAAHYMSAQGPITAFIHHNTLHAFEHLPFDEGVQQGGRLFGCQPYLAEDNYREHLRHGRIRLDDLEAILHDDLGAREYELVLGGTTKFLLRRAMLEYPHHSAPIAELRWHVAETDALNRFRNDAPADVRQRQLDTTRQWVLRDLQITNEQPPHASQYPVRKRARAALQDLLEHFGASSIESWSDATWESFTLHALWRVCRDGVHGISSPAAGHASAIRHRDILFEATGVDSDLPVQDLLIRFTSAFLDQGFSHWPLPHRENGYFQAFIAIYQQRGGLPDQWMAGLAGELNRLRKEGLSPLQSIDESLCTLGVPESEWTSYITATLLALRGWAGMVRQVELRADSVANRISDSSFQEFVAVRLILDRIAIANIARDSISYEGTLNKLRQALSAHRPKQPPPGIEQRAFHILQLAQVLGWSPQCLYELPKQAWVGLVAEIESFPVLDRRRTFHAAFERRYRTQTLDAFAVRARQGEMRFERPRFQVACCLDEREESFRRHLEEICPSIETIGVAGFYGVAMYYRGAGDAHYVPLCPIVIKPKHWVREDAQEAHSQQHRKRAKVRRALGMAWHQLHIGSRGVAAGALLATGIGSLASVPLVARVLFPRLTARIREMAGDFIRPPAMTDLELERQLPEAGPENDHRGYTVLEMTEIAERLLRDMGLIDNFARLVAILGHGSNSLNNPHNSAYNCGACGGNAGFPNARASARILNESRVRAALVGRGIEISESTHFLGGFHNTCNDSVVFFDRNRVPTTHANDFNDLTEIIEEACNRNAHERCRRFQSAPLNMSFPAARRHVEARSEDLAQTRPECGHASNSLCIVGRRTRNRGLYLDRRAFLTTYDPTQDDAENSILTRILQAAVPVCAGINLEYYFSYVDPTGYGCGSKLPHNVTSLLGVMDGAASDLRTGLPWQMVEIHEPVRLLFLVETTPEAMLRIMERNPGIGQVCKNGWVQLATLDPDLPRIHFFEKGRFVPYEPESNELPVAPSSTDWYRGSRHHLDYALIAPTSAKGSAN